MWWLIISDHFTLNMWILYFPMTTLVYLWRVFFVLFDIFHCQHLPNELTRFGKTWLPCHGFSIIIPWSWRNMIMIMPWWRHGGYASWQGRHESWYDHSMITMFSMIHTIIMFSVLFFFEKENNFWQFFFSDNCCQKPFYGTFHWTLCLQAAEYIKLNKK